MSTNANRRYTLFGGDKGWHSEDWHASDDRVRGGKSISHLDCTEKTGTFRGNLDIKTLGGAGFASQRTTGEDREWDLSKYAGIELCISKGDKKRYTFNLKDELLTPDPDTGREQASISYECDFELPPQTEPGDTHDKTVFIPWSSFNATYRGRPKKDAKPIDLKQIKRLSIMMRSFFGTQEGDFSLSIRSICALAHTPSQSALQPRGSIGDLEKGVPDFDAWIRGSANSVGNMHHIDPSQANDTQASPSETKRGTYAILAALSVLAAYHLIRKYWRNCD
ncbi:Putative complex I intermediate-associated protein 30 [Septoria linicola]|uniref:Complex I intermediate-associated protein 30 n=1 Tax=Septoria linicola TaxID=215465 RepID=A0A9Q9AIH7_9PEZI|nr:putative complex I intermediate-associated protein 30 [Septoria linicola]USW47050.1 Putative complex I intermediate-associated protein 30 [Septoria linicola]